MKPSERRAAMKDQMLERHKESYDSKDDSGRFKSIYNKGALGSIGMWKCTEDEHFINIIPFLAGPNHPKVAEGKWAFNLDVFVHFKVGVNEDSYICLARTYGKSCPICDYQAELRKQDDYDEDYVKSLNPKRRIIYNIQCLDNDKEMNKGVQIFDVSHWLFGKEIDELAKKPRGGGMIPYADSDEGKTIYFRKKGSTATNTEYKAFRFEDRDVPITDDLLDSAVTLDEVVHIPTYNEVKNAFFGTDADDEVPEQHLENTRNEAETTARQSQRTSRQAESPKFKCPGVFADDFGTHEECDKCPDVDACEKQFNEQEEAAAVGVNEPEPEPAKEPEPVKEPERVVRRQRPSAEPEAAKEEPAPPQQSEGRVIRRRPGQ